MADKLWLPNTTRSNSHHPILATANQFYSAEQITGVPSGVPDIVEKLAPVSRTDVLRLLCSHSMALMSDRGMSPAHHLAWARDVFPSEWIPKLEQLIAADGVDAGCLFHKRSAWFVLQIALLTCQKDTAPLPEGEAARRVWQACFLANDVVASIENRRDRAPEGDVTDWMIATIVPLHGIDSHAIDFAHLGRSQLLWIEAATGSNFVRELKRLGVPDPETTFKDRYGIPLSDFIRFLVALYVRFSSSEAGRFNPLKLSLHKDALIGLFAEDFRTKAISLISQLPDVLLLDMLSTRQSWIYDVSFLRERPLLELNDAEFCCPDLVLLTRTGIDRVYYLLQDAYGKDKFRQLFGYLFEEYVHRLFDTFVVSEGIGRTYWASPKFVGAEAQAADGVLLWSKTAVIMEFKAGLLTTRQRYSGFEEELLHGIDCLLGDKADEKKGVAQLIRTLKRTLSGDSIHVHDHRVDLTHCERIYPVLICFDEPLAMHAVTRRLQKRFDELCISRGIPRDKVGPLMLLSIRDLEVLSSVGHTLSVEKVFHEYSNHLDHQPRDFTGSFTSVVAYHFANHIEMPKTPNSQRLISLLDEMRKQAEELPQVIEDSDSRVTDV